MITIKDSVEAGKGDYVLTVNIPVWFVTDARVRAEEERPFRPEHLRDSGNLSPAGLEDLKVELTQHAPDASGIQIFMHPKTYKRLRAFGYNFTGYESSEVAGRYKDGDTTFHLFEWVDEGTVVGMYQDRVGVIVNCVDKAAA